MCVVVIRFVLFPLFYSMVSPQHFSNCRRKVVGFPSSLVPVCNCPRCLLSHWPICHILNHYYSVLILLHLCISRNQQVFVCLSGIVVMPHHILSSFLHSLASWLFFCYLNTGFPHHSLALLPRPSSSMTETQRLTPR